MLFFSLIQKLELDKCYRCGERIKNHRAMSIDHKKPWLNISTDRFWDIDNIAYSHLSCNSAKRASYSNNNHPSYSKYSRGCRCEACKRCKLFYQRYIKWRNKYEAR